MGVIKDRQMALGTVYERYDNKGEVIHKTGAIGFIKKSKNQTYFIIHDLQGNLITEANYYLNKIIANDGYKKRELAFTALKLFFSFVQLFHVENYRKELDYEHITKLLLFLEGGVSKGTAWDMNIQTIRRNGTIKSYLNVYRDFYKKVFREENNPLFQKTSIAIAHGQGLLGHTQKHAVERYVVNKPNRNRNRNVPKYIKQDEFISILEVVRKQFSMREEIIIRLMYEYGLRLGEVLGLTFEDIEPASNDYWRLVIRNRLSDKPYQSAKGLMQIKSISDYHSPSYSTYKAGFHIVLLRQDFKDLIDEYIDETRDVFLLNKSQKKRENLHTKSFADKVSSSSVLNGENQYIFLSQQNYTPLTASGWNYILRKIFNIVGINNDSEVRKNNLSHRFRHGFAMNKVKEGYTVEKLAEALRHSSIESCSAYYNPDEEDIVKLLEQNDDRLKERFNIE